MFPCLHIPCTCERTAQVTSVASVERSFQDRGCWKDTCGRTLEKNLTGVPSVKSLSLTSQTWELTFRLMRRQKWENNSLFYSQKQPPFYSIALQLQQMWKRICTQVLSGETRRGGMYQLNNWGFGNVFVRGRKMGKATTLCLVLQLLWVSRHCTSHFPPFEFNTSDYCYPDPKGLDLLITCVWNKSV